MTLFQVCLILCILTGIFSLLKIGYFQRLNDKIKKFKFKEEDEMTASEAKKTLEFSVSVILQYVFVILPLIVLHLSTEIWMLFKGGHTTICGIVLLYQSFIHNEILILLKLRKRGDFGKPFTFMRLASFALWGYPLYLTFM